MREDKIDKWDWFPPILFLLINVMTLCIKAKSRDCTRSFSLMSCFGTPLHGSIDMTVDYIILERCVDGAEP